MAQNSKFCPDCGNEILAGETFCSSCGKAISKPSGKFSSLSGFQTETQQPIMMMQGAQPWKGGGLATASKEIFTDTNRVAPSLLQDPSSPNPIIIVIILGILSAVFAYVTQIKTVVIIGEDIPSEMISQIDQTGGASILTLATSFIGIFLEWYIGSWLLGLFLKGGFPPNNILKFETSAAMRKLNAYRYIPAIIGLSILTVILFVSPDQTATYHMDLLPFLNIEAPLPVYSGFGSLYNIALAAIEIIAGLISIYLLYKAVMANGYQGSMLYVVIIISFLVNVLPFF